MGVSRIWTVLLAAIVGAALAVLLVIPKQDGRDLARAQAYRLDIVQHNAEMLLRIRARESIDLAAAMTRDARLAQALAQVPANQRDLKPIQAAVDSAILDLLAQIAKDRRPELAILVDKRGKQIARIGPGEDKFVSGQFGISGYPLVAAALRGYLRDDAWSVNGKLFAMAAAPVLSRRQDRYVGALVLGKQVDNVFAEAVKHRLGSTDLPGLGSTDIAFFLRGRTIASTLAPHTLTKLPLEYTKRRAKIARTGRSAAVAVGNDSGSHVVVMAPIVGEAAAHDAFYAVVTPSPVINPGLYATITRIRGADLSLSIVLRALGTFVALLVIGLILVHMDTEGGIKRLLGDMRQVGHGDVSRLPQRHYPGRQAELARLINEALDRVARRPPQGSASGLGYPAVSDATRSGLGHPAVRDVGRSGLRHPAVRDVGRSSTSHPAVPAITRPVPADIGLGEPDDVDIMPPLAPIEGTASLRPAVSQAGARTPAAPHPAARPSLVDGESGHYLLEELDDEVDEPTTPRDSMVAAQDADEIAPLELFDANAQVHTSAGPTALAMESSGARFSDDIRAMIEPVGSSPALEALGSGEVEAVTEWDGERRALETPEIDPFIIPDSNAQRQDATPVFEPFAGLSAEENPEQTPLLEPLEGIRSYPSIGVRSGEEEYDTVMSSVPQHMARNLVPGDAPIDFGSVGTHAPAFHAPPPTLSPEDEALEQQFRQTYRQFLAVKKSCGEDTETLTYERFSHKLRKNRDALMARYGCKEVQFRVYVKDGKAALRATPIQD